MDVATGQYNYNDKVTLTIAPDSGKSIDTTNSKIYKKNALGKFTVDVTSTFISSWSTTNTFYMPAYDILIDVQFN